MLIAPSIRPLWQPPKFRLPRWLSPSEWFAEGDAVLDSTGNLILDASGNFKLKDASPDCCCSCSHCASTPPDMTVTLSGFTHCSGCFRHPTNGYDYDFSAITIDGTYTLPQDRRLGTNCLYYYQTFRGTRSRYGPITGASLCVDTFRETCDTVLSLHATLQAGPQVEIFVHQGYNEFADCPDPATYYNGATGRTIFWGIQSISSCRSVTYTGVTNLLSAGACIFGRAAPVPSGTLDITIN